MQNDVALVLHRKSCGNPRAMSIASRLARLAVLDPAASARQFHTVQRLLKNTGISKPVKVLESDIEEAFLKGSGPGGQKIVGDNGSALVHERPGLLMSSGVE